MILSKLLLTLSRHFQVCDRRGRIASTSISQVLSHTENVPFLLASSGTNHSRMFQSKKLQKFKLSTWPKDLPLPCNFYVPDKPCLFDWRQDTETSNHFTPLMGPSYFTQKHGPALPALSKPETASCQLWHITHSIMCTDNDIVIGCLNSYYKNFPCERPCIFVLEEIGNEIFQLMGKAPRPHTTKNRCWLCCLLKKIDVSGWGNLVLLNS